MSVLSSSGDKSSRWDFRIPARFTSSNRLPSFCLSSSLRRLLSHTAMCPAPNYGCHKTRSAQSTGLEFGHRSFDLLAASPLLNPDLSDSRHADNASKTRPQFCVQFRRFRPRFAAMRNFTSLAEGLSLSANEDEISLYPIFISHLRISNVVVIPIADTGATWDLFVAWQRGKTSGPLRVLLDALTLKSGRSS
jgi:hypothetical protein